MSSSKKIVVVDDEKDILDLIAAFFGQSQHQTELFSTGEDALKYIVKAAQVDIIFSDFNMPGTNGLELTKQIRAQNFQMPIIMMSGFYLHQQRALRMGVTDFISKPVRQNHLFLKITEYTS